MSNILRLWMNNRVTVLSLRNNEPLLPRDIENGYGKCQCPTYSTAVWGANRLLRARYHDNTAKHVHTHITRREGYFKDAGLLIRCVPQKLSSTEKYSISPCWSELGQPTALLARCRMDFLGSVAIRTVCVSWTCFPAAHETKNNLYTSLLQQRHRGWTLGHSTRE